AIQTESRSRPRSHCQSPNEAKHLDIQKTGKHPAHKGPGYADKDIGENAMVGFSHLFCDPSRRLLRSTASKRSPLLDDREILVRFHSHSPPSSASNFGRLAVRLLLCPCLPLAKVCVIHVAGHRRSGQIRSEYYRYALFRRRGQFRSDHRRLPRLRRPSRPTACSDPTSLLSAA